MNRIQAKGLTFKAVHGCLAGETAESPALCSGAWSCFLDLEQRWS